MKGLPEKGQQVFVIAPSGAGAPARVADVTEVATVLSFADYDTNPVTALAGGSVSIQYTNRRGVCRLDGAAQRTDAAEILRVEHAGKVELIQRREFVRVDAMIPVSYRPLGPGGPLIETTTVNVSAGGFMIAGREGLHIHDAADFTLALDGETNEDGPLEVGGKVVRETPGGLGIEITAVDDDERERLVRWVFARERLALRLVKGL